MMRKSYFDEEHTFRPVRIWDVTPGVPVIVTKDNGDGTFQGKYDFARMSTVQKIAYHPLPSLVC